MFQVEGLHDYQCGQILKDDRPFQAHRFSPIASLQTTKVNRSASCASHATDFSLSCVETHTTASTNLYCTIRIIGNAYMRCVRCGSVDAYLKCLQRVTLEIQTGNPSQQRPFCGGKLKMNALYNLWKAVITPPPALSSKPCFGTESYNHE
ncbi:hypothetical protein SFRURICE_007067 [Spodoptera frugiperda]|uniref:SFRICE_014061 n=1 Tax=Spodoptera frugiperda TaxID=7108 RepID=A0A2H1V6W3_SPOFR|nr:hypothetical protein SFRURICE_007067 [Spodoptera frugiperda]